MLQVNPGVFKVQGEKVRADTFVNAKTIILMVAVANSILWGVILHIGSWAFGAEITNDWLIGIMLGFFLLTIGFHCAIMMFSD